MDGFSSSDYGAPRQLRHSRDLRTTDFGWNRPRLRSLALASAGTLFPTAMIFATSPAALSWICLAWLVAMARTLYALDARAEEVGDVLSIDERGILDRRIMERRIAWQEIAFVCQTDITRSHVVDIALRCPKSTLGRARWTVRIGACCQTGYGVPAVTLSMLLLEGTVVDVLDAIARYRPDLLHHSNRPTVVAHER